MGDKNVYHFKVKRASKKKSDPHSTEEKQRSKPAVTFPFASQSQDTAAHTKPSVSVKEHLDFEKIILEKMRQASQQQQKLKEEQERKTHENTREVKNNDSTSAKPLFAAGSENTENNDENNNEVDLNRETLEEMKIRQAKEREELRRKLLEEDD